MKRFFSFAPLCLTLGCMSTPSVSRHHWYTCEYQCYGHLGVMEATAAQGKKECVCFDDQRFPYPSTEENEILEEMFDKLEPTEGGI